MRAINKLFNIYIGMEGYMGSGVVAGEIRANPAQTLLIIGQFCQPLVCCLGISNATSQSEYLRIVKDF
jgi:hypothetical protein